MARFFFCPDLSSLSLPLLSLALLSFLDLELSFFFTSFPLLAALIESWRALSVAFLIESWRSTFLIESRRAVSCCLIIVESLSSVGVCPPFWLSSFFELMDLIPNIMPRNDSYSYYCSNGILNPLI